jgi:sialic acid synthase SpsE
MGAQPLVGPNTKHLLCVSAYPAPVEALNLHRLRPCHDSSGLCCEVRYDGFSDHTTPHLTVTGALAVAAGAQIIEAHVKAFTTDPKNPDAPHAMHPGQFAEYVTNIRLAETCLAGTEVQREKAERAMSAYRVVNKGLRVPEVAQ